MNAYGIDNAPQVFASMPSKETITVLPDDFRALKSMATPTLVIGGSLDTFTPAVLAEQ